MHRIDHVTASADHNGAGKDGFTEGDPVGGVAPTVVTDDWLNDVQENVAEVIDAQSIALVKGDGGQLNAAIDAKVANISYHKILHMGGGSPEDSFVGPTPILQHVLPANETRAEDLLRITAFVHAVNNSGVSKTLGSLILATDNPLTLAAMSVNLVVADGEEAFIRLHSEVAVGDSDQAVSYGYAMAGVNTLGFGTGVPFPGGNDTAFPNLGTFTPGSDQTIEVSASSGSSAHASWTVQCLFMLIEKIRPNPGA